MEADSRLRLRAPYTPQECAEMLPRWQSVLETDAAALRAAIRAGDGGEIHRCSVNVLWDARNLAGIGLDMVASRTTIQDGVPIWHSRSCRCGDADCPASHE